MKKLFYIIASLFLAGAVNAASVKEDIQAQGNISYLHKNITAQIWSATFRNYETVAATKTLVYTDCGKTVFLSHATEFVTTLPLPVAGCYFKFVVANAPETASYTVVTSASANIIIGGTDENEVDTNSDGPYDADADTVTFADGVAVVGDYVEIISDGTSWYISGQANADGGITITKAS